MVPISLVYSIYDSTEVAIQKMIDASQTMLDVQSQLGGEAKEGWGINPIMKKHLELDIKALQNAPRDPDKLERLLKVKQRKKEEADHIEDIQRLVTEIEMLKVVLYSVCRKQSNIAAEKVPNKKSLFFSLFFNVFSLISVDKV